MVDSSFREGCWIYSRYKYEAVDTAKKKKVKVPYYVKFK